MHVMAAAACRYPIFPSIRFFADSPESPSRSCRRTSYIKEGVSCWNHSSSSSHLILTCLGLILSRLVYFYASFFPIKPSPIQHESRTAGPPFVAHPITGLLLPSTSWHTLLSLVPCYSTSSSHLAETVPRVQLQKLIYLCLFLPKIIFCSSDKQEHLHHNIQQ